MPAALQWPRRLRGPLPPGILRGKGKHACLESKQALVCTELVACVIAKFSFLETWCV